MKRHWPLALLLAWLIAACATPAEPDTPTQPRRKLTIAWIHKTLGNPVFELGKRGALARAAELSAQGPVEVEVILIGPVAADAVAQMQLVEDMIARRVDAIAISCNDPTACIEPINRAIAAGIPVMTWDSDSPESQRFTYLGIDNYRAGRVAADLLADAIGQRGKVAVITGVLGALNLEQRVQGFRDGMQAYPEIEIIAVIPTNEDINLGVQRVEETMQKEPNLRGWFFAGLWPLFAERGSMPLWEQASQAGQIETVTFDTLPVELDMLKDGYLSALIGQKYWGWGYDSVQIIYDHIINGKQFPTTIDSGMDIVTITNADAMIRAWETNDFSQPLPPAFPPGEDPIRPIP
ncbi:MAG: sugar-binding protein [Roseiflexaceae bacterium]